MAPGQGTRNWFAELMRLRSWFETLLPSWFHIVSGPSLADHLELFCVSQAPQETACLLGCNLAQISRFAACDGAVVIDESEYHLLLLGFAKTPDAHELREFAEAAVQGCREVVATSLGTPAGFHQTTVGKTVQNVASLVLTDLK